MFVQTSEVTVRGLTFEGERLAGSFVGLGELKGIFLRESSANVEGCAFHGFRESVPGEEDATAITATGFGDGEVNLRVAGCTFLPLTLIVTEAPTASAPLIHGNAACACV